MFKYEVGQLIWRVGRNKRAISERVRERKYDGITTFYLLESGIVEAERSLFSNGRELVDDVMSEVEWE